MVHVCHVLWIVSVFGCAYMCVMCICVSVCGRGV